MRAVGTCGGEVGRGARALAEALKQNSTLTALDLSGVLRPIGLEYSLSLESKAELPSCPSDLVQTKIRLCFCDRLKVSSF